MTYWDRLSFSKALSYYKNLCLKRIWQTWRRLPPDYSICLRKLFQDWIEVVLNFKNQRSQGLDSNRAFIYLRLYLASCLLNWRNKESWNLKWLMNLSLSLPCSQLEPTNGKLHLQNGPFYKSTTHLLSFVNGPQSLSQLCNRYDHTFPKD